MKFLCMASICFYTKSSTNACRWKRKLASHKSCGIIHKLASRQTDLLVVSLLKVTKKISFLELHWPFLGTNVVYLKCKLFLPYFQLLNFSASCVKCEIIVRICKFGIYHTTQGKLPLVTACSVSLNDENFVLQRNEWEIFNTKN